MDEFGLLVESMGFRANGKSAPMAELKPKPKSHFSARTTGTTRGFDDSSSLPVDELDGIFRSNFSVTKTNQSQNFFGGDDIFGVSASNSHHYGGVDLDSVFSSSSNRRKDSHNLSSRSSVGSDAYDDLLGTVGSKSKKADAVAVDDLFGVFEGNGNQENKRDGLDDLVPGFGGASPSNIKAYSKTYQRPSHSSSVVADDPFLVFERSAPQSDASWPFNIPSEKNAGKGSVQTSMDDLDDFLMGGSKVKGSQTTSNKLNPGVASNGFESTNYMDDIFGGGNHMQQKNAAKPSSVAKSSSFDDFFHEEKRTEVKRSPSQSSFNTKKPSSAMTVGHDVTSLFGDMTTSSGEFQEIEGEPADRRTARLKRYMMTNARMAEALAEKNQRDLQHQREQEEKRVLAETLDNEIRRWAAGKEGNLRALLSSLQQILGPESRWRPVGLTDMITSESVKKVYKKANLYVHPDKVQQRGASIEQQYIAEKVFDLIKEAWTKFSSEELR